MEAVANLSQNFCASKARSGLIERLAGVVLCVMVCLIPAHAQGPDGLELAQRIRSAEPNGDSQITGVVRIEVPKKDGDSRNKSNWNKKQVREIPLTLKTVRRGSNWETIYETTALEGYPAERLVVVHSTNAPNQYFHARAASPSAPIPELQPIPANKAASIAFAGSDFSAADLGLDFLHWPQQERLSSVKRLNQPCYVLDSRDPAQQEIVRVKSFIDQESADAGIAGILVAEAYDRKNDEVKIFSLHGSSFKKVNGQYHLEKMEIENVKTGSVTILKFNLDNLPK
jgi:hypothetical protein